MNKRLREVWADDWTAWGKVDPDGAKQCLEWARSEAKQADLTPVITGVEWWDEKDLPLISAMTSDDRWLYCTFEAQSCPPCWPSTTLTTIEGPTDV